MFSKRNDLLEKLENALSEKQTWMERATEMDTRVKRLESENEILQNKVEALESLNNREVKTYAREIKLNNREKILEAQEGLESELKKKVKVLEQEVENAKDKGYKAGYADGTADGIRKGMDLTQDDRKMMAQIAALSAASHVPDATSMIAREVANGIAKDIRGLPDTAGTTDKKAK